jgi:hypothetical protein
MRRATIASWAFLGAAAFLTAGPAYGQLPYRPYGGGTYMPYAATYMPYGTGAYARQPLSPYLNLARTDAPPAINYYNLVRPQIAFSNAIQNLQLQVDQIAPQTGQPGEAPPAEITTGHPFGFMNHTAYFQNLGTQGAYRGATGTRYPTTTQTYQRTPAPTGRRY